MATFHIYYFSSIRILGEQQNQYNKKGRIGKYFFD